MSEVPFATDEELVAAYAPNETRGGGRGVAGRISTLRINKSEWDILDSHGFRCGLRIRDRKSKACNPASLHERLRAFNDKLPARVTLKTETHGRDGNYDRKSIEVTMTKVRQLHPSQLGDRPDLDLVVYFESPDFKTMQKGGAK